MLQIEPAEDQGIDERAMHAVLCGQHRGNRQLRIAAHLANGRIGGIHGLDLDQGRALVAGIGHGTHGGHHGDLAARLQPGSFPRGCLALHEGESGIAAEDTLALAAEALTDAAGCRCDRRDGRHAERKAGNEHAEAFQPAAQIAPCQPECK
jgi:hypothetical protein